MTCTFGTIYRRIERNVRICLSLSLHSAAMFPKRRSCALPRSCRWRDTVNWRYIWAGKTGHPGDMVIDEHLIEHVCDTSKYAIDELRERDFTDICEMLYHSGRIFVYGTEPCRILWQGSCSVCFILRRICLCSIRWKGNGNGSALLEAVMMFWILISLRERRELINEFASASSKKHQNDIHDATENNELAHKCTKASISQPHRWWLAIIYFMRRQICILVLAELLFLRYSQYKQKQDGIGIR